MVTALVLSLLLPPTTSASCPCNTTSNYALLMDFYTTTTGWINNHGWGDPTVAICDWWGIACSGTNVTSILLQSNGISGTLPPSWSNMAQLQLLALYSNNLTGTLPPSWSSMAQLQLLYLYSNSLTGTLPASWSSMTEP